jgi:hypothetical protein
MSTSLESLSIHALTEIESKQKLNDSELSLFRTLPAFNPGAITPPLLSTIFPFSSINLIKEQLALLVKKGLLLPTKENYFALTREGDALSLWITKEVNNALSGVLPLPALRMMDMASQMKEIADSCYAATEPPAKLQLTLQRKLIPAGTIPMMARIRQITRELIAYRADAHQTAWQAYGVSGHSWEILSTLWQEKKQNVDVLHGSLAQRGFSMEETLNSINELSRRGWVLNSNEDVSITAFGSEVRSIAEDTTDRYYFGPWQKFSDTRITTLKELVEEFRRGIPVLVENMA